MSKDEIADLRAQVAALTEQLSHLKWAVKWAPSSAHWSNVLVAIAGPDAREGIANLEKRLRGSQARNSALTDALGKAREALQPFVGATLTRDGHIIGLMREHFVNAGEALAAIDAALGEAKPSPT